MGCARYFPALLLVMFLVARPSTSVAYEGGGNQPPTVYNVSAAIFSGYVWIVGYVSDPDDSPVGNTVYVEGSVSGTCTVTSQGKFWFVAVFAQPYGEAAIHTVDVHGARSSDVFVEFIE